MLINRKISKKNIKNNELPNNSLHLSPTDENISSKNGLFNESSIILGLFIGYLVEGFNKYPIDKYDTLSNAYFDIQLRGIMITLGTLSMLIASFINYCLDDLIGIDFKNDNIENEQIRRNNLYLFMNKLHYLQMGLNCISYLCFLIFICCFNLELYILYSDYISFETYFITSGILGLIFLGILIYIYYLKYIAYNNLINL